MSGPAGGATPRVLVVSGSVGAGHDGAADELIARLQALGVTADRRDYLDAVPLLGRIVLREGYSLSIGYAPGFFDWLFNSLERAGWVRRVTMLLCWAARFPMRRWAREREVVVSTYPLASQTLGMLRASGDLDADVVTYLTDPAVHRMWVHPGVDHHLTVTEATSRMGRLAYRTPMRAVGGLVPPRFGAPLPADRKATLRAELGLRDDRPVVMVVTGSLGLGEVPGVAREIAATGSAQVLVLCGRNTRLRNQFTAEDEGIVAVGWRDDVPELMAMADVLVHNAGGLTLTEALTAGLPAITFRPIPGHGTANAATLADAGLAPWPKDSAELVAAVRDATAARREGVPASLRDGGRRSDCAVVREVDAAQVVTGLLHEHPTGRARRSA